MFRVLGIDNFDACLDKVSPPVARFTNFFALIAHLQTVRTISINGPIFQKLLPDYILKVV